MNTETYQCCLCGQDIEPSVTGYMEGHNADPLTSPIPYAERPSNMLNGRCCTKCNFRKVIPARMKALDSRLAQVEELAEDIHSHIQRLIKNANKAD